MSRNITSDFELFEEFIKKYELRDNFTDSSARAQLKKSHHDYLSLLFLWSEINIRIKDGKIDLLNHNHVNPTKSVSYIEESISDIGNGLLCCIHGIYKPAFTALRSSIENFFKAIAFFYFGEKSETTVISNIFDMSKETKPFMHERQPAYSRLRETYSHLCAYTHTASLAHMSKVHALSTFPHFDNEKFSEWNKYLRRICKDFFEIILFWMRNVYHKAHFRAKEIFEETLGKKLSREINIPETP